MSPAFTRRGKASEIVGGRLVLGFKNKKYLYACFAILSTIFCAPVKSQTAGTYFDATFGGTAATLPPAPFTYKTLTPLPVGLSAASTPNGLHIFGTPTSPGAINLAIYAIGNSIVTFNVPLNISANTTNVVAVGATQNIAATGVANNPYHASLGVLSGGVLCPLNVAALAPAYAAANLTLDAAGNLSSPSLNIAAAISLSVTCAGAGAATATFTLNPAPTAPVLTAATVEGSLATIAALTGATISHTPALVSKLVDQGTTVTITGTAQDTISIYQYDAGYNLPSTAPIDCQNGDPNKRTILSIVTSSVAPITSSTSFTLTSNQPTTLTLSNPLVAGTTLCFVETASGAPPSSAGPFVVSDPGDFGRFRAYFIGGVQVSNQQSATNSSTAGQYLEAGFNSTYALAKKHTPGLGTNIDIRLSPIPVAAPSTTTTTVMTTVPTTISTLNPNQLSSQQSVRFVGSIFAPWKTTHWNNKSDYFTIGPVTRGGFGTLLNPSVGSGANNSSGTTTTTVTTTSNFASAYYFLGAGARFAWERYPAKSDEGPQTLSQFLVTIADYSSLPSYVCKPTTGLTNPYASTNTTTIVTACSVQPQYPIIPPSGTTTTYSYFTDSRTLRPRMDIEGFVMLPGYPFILGINANLEQSGLGKRSNLDYLNKPGNDIRIYIGLKIDIATLISKL